MLIIIIIVSILAIVGKGSYDGYVEKSRWAEAYSVVYTLMNAQKDFYILHGRFADDIDELGVDIDGKRIENRFVNANLLGKGALGIKTKYFVYGTTSSKFVKPSNSPSHYDTAVVMIARPVTKRGVNNYEIGRGLTLVYYDNDASYGNVPIPTGSFYSTGHAHWDWLEHFTIARKQMENLEKDFKFKFW